MSEPLLSVEGLRTTFETAAGPLAAVNDVSFSIRQGETLGLVGESGSGKSVTAFSIIRLVQTPGRVTAGRVVFQGRDLLTLPEEDMRQVRGAGIGFVFQEPMAALNPVMRVGAHIAEALRVHGLASRAEARPGHRPAARGQDHGRRAARRRLPAPALGRHAPARDVGHRARLPAAPGDRRRADHGPGRDRAGADPRPAAGHEARVRRQPAAHHPRSRRHRRDRGPGRHHVRRPHRGAGAGARRSSGHRHIPTRAGCWPRSRAVPRARG